MVLFYDVEEKEKLENNVEYLKWCINKLNHTMKYECLGDLERYPYKLEKERLEKKLLTLIK